MMPYSVTRKKKHTVRMHLEIDKVRKKKYHMLESKRAMLVSFLINEGAFYMN